MPHDKRVSYGVALLIWRDQTKVLLMHRPKTLPHAPDCWSVPGGWVDFGERSFETCLREASEELGVKLHPVVKQDLANIEEEVWPEEDVQSLTLYFNATVAEGEPRIMEPHKCDEIRWVDLLAPDTWPRPLFPNLESALVEIAVDLADVADCL